MSVTPSTPAEQRIWDLYSEDIKALVAASPAPSPDQVRAIREIWLSILTRKASK